MTATALAAPLVQATELVDPVAPGGRLVAAALIAIALIVVLITWAKVHPFLALILGGLTVGIVAGQNVNDVITSFSTGFGSTAAGVGALIALGAMFAKLLADSGGADQIVDTIVGKASARTLPWAMAGVGALIGLPMFFEIGLVLLMPVIYLVARRSGQSIITIGIPTLAGLSAMHGLVPPHPGPLAAIDSLSADLGTTLLFGVIVAVPTVIVSGPLFGKLAGRWVDVPAPDRFEVEESEHARRPGFGVTVATVLLPVVLMMGRSLADITLDEDSVVRQTLDVIGNPFVALLLATLAAMVTFGFAVGMDRAKVTKTVETSLPAIAGILLIVSAGGGFKQVLVDTGVGTLLADWAKESNVSVLLLAWVVAVLIRLATGSATVATITASALMASLVQGMPQTEVALVVLAIGAGSVFFSHVNDAGFWLVKEYFGLSVSQTIRSWSLMETVLSVSGLVFVLLLGLVV
ncbi:gluconate:H+ symporter [Nocardioides marinquilinus]|uniref:Gluconate:H+ symporter n=1 Tax=Nocardioides marinquilinus TaxID=1210400 RepID=A0ABP9Q3I5_9ACTN